MQCKFPKMNEISRDGYKVYRISGWYFGDRTNPNFISYSEMADRFPNWISSIRTPEEKADSLYRYVYMGFGNSLCIKKDLYESFMKHLELAIDKYAEDRNIDSSEKEERRYAIIFSVWGEAVVNMAADANVALL